MSELGVEFDALALHLCNMSIAGHGDVEHGESEVQICFGLSHALGKWPADPVPKEKIKSFRRLRFDLCKAPREDACLLVWVRCLTMSCIGDRAHVVVATGVVQLRALSGDGKILLIDHAAKRAYPHQRDLYFRGELQFRGARVECPGAFESAPVYGMDDFLASVAQKKSEYAAALSGLGELEAGIK